MTVRNGPPRRAAVLALLACVIVALGTIATWAPAAAQGAAPVDARSPGDPAANLRALLDDGQWAVAAQIEGPRLVEAEPESREAWWLYGRALQLTGNTERAREAVARARAADGPESDPRLDWLEGRIRLDSGDIGGAATLLSGAAVATNDYGMLMDWGRLEWQRARFEDALEAFERAAATPEGRAAPWAELSRGRILVLLERYLEALEAFDAVVAILEETDTGDGLPSPAYAEAFFRSGEAHERLGNLEEAVNYFSLARMSDPGFSPAADALDRLRQAEP